MKEVKEMTSKINFYFNLLGLLKQGKTLTNISEELSISKQKISYYTRILKELGFIEKKGYGVWEVKRSKKEDLEHTLNWRNKKIRGHAFIWKVKLSKNFNWEELLNLNKVNYKLVRGYIPRIFINDKKVWLGKESVVIYETKSFYGESAIESRKYAVLGLQETMATLFNKLGITSKYYFKPVREHFGMIKNELARQCNKKGEKIIVRDNLDGNWLWIDDSESLSELETGGKGFTQDRTALNLNVQRWYNDHKKHNFQVTPSFLMESLNKLMNIQIETNTQLLEYKKQNEQHLQLIKDYRKENVAWRKGTVKEIKNELKNGKQLKLNDLGFL